MSALSSLKFAFVILLLSTVVHSACSEASNHIGNPININFEVQEPGNIDIAVTTKGVDVSAAQHNIDWRSVADHGVAFAYVQATAGTTFLNPEFPPQWNGATAAGLLLGAYHSARPNQSSGTVQADLFLSRGGACIGGRNLPGAIELADLPDSPACYGMGSKQIIEWISDFSTEYFVRTGIFPVIHTNPNWWIKCTDGFHGFTGSNPLWFVNFGSSVGALPGWSTWTFWKYAAGGPFPGGQNNFNGDLNALKSFADC